MDNVIKKNGGWREHSVVESVALVGNPRLRVNTHIGWLTTSCNSRSRGSTILQLPSTHANTHIHTHVHICAHALKKLTRRKTQSLNAVGRKTRLPLLGIELWGVLHLEKWWEKKQERKTW